jgi:hypothetical protein
MAREPSYPKDAAVGAEAASGDRDRPDARDGTAEAAPTASRGKKHLVAGAAIGIGSAAIVAALLYANRRKQER